MGGHWGMLLIAGGALGCHEHVVLNAPPPSAPLEERTATYEKLHPLTMHETHITYLRGGTPVGATREVDYLQLADGQRVYYPEDLLPVVDESSSTAKAAERSHSARSTSYALKGAGYGGIFLGAGIMLVPVLQSHQPGESMNMTPIWVGAGVMILGAVVGLVGGTFAGTANDEASTAFETYDESLRDRLDLNRPTNEPGQKPRHKRAPNPEPSEASDGSDSPAPKATGAPEAGE